MSVILQPPGPRSLRIIASGASGAASRIMQTPRSQAYLLRRIAVFANHDARVLAS